MQQEQTKALIVNVMTAVVVLGVLVAVYFVFIKQNVSVPSVATTSSVADVAKIAEETALIGTEIDYTVRDLSELARAVENSNVIFELPAFKSLEDFTVPIWGEAIGRANPFTPTEWKLKLSALVDKAENVPQEAPKETVKKETTLPPQEPVLPITPATTTTTILPPLPL